MASVTSCVFFPPLFRLGAALLRVYTSWIYYFIIHLPKKHQFVTVRYVFGSRLSSCTWNAFRSQVGNSDLRPWLKRSISLHCHQLCWVATVATCYMLTSKYFLPVTGHSYGHRRVIGGVSRQYLLLLKYVIRYCGTIVTYVFMLPAKSLMFANYVTCVTVTII